MRYTTIAMLAATAILAACNSGSSTAPAPAPTPTPAPSPSPTPVPTGKISFMNQAYLVDRVNTNNSACAGAFGKALQSAVDADPIYAFVSAVFNTNTFIGTAYLIAEHPGVVQPFLSAELDTQGIKNEWAFAAFFNPAQPVSIDGTSYDLGAARYVTTGQTNAEWIQNGTSEIAFVNPSYPSQLCDVDGGPTSNAAARAQGAALKRPVFK